MTCCVTRNVKAETLKDTITDTKGKGRHTCDRLSDIDIKALVKTPAETLSEYKVATLCDTLGKVWTVALLHIVAEIFAGMEA